MPDYDASDINDEFERTMLALWWADIAEDGASRVRTPSWIQRALYAASRVEFFSGLSERTLIGSLKQLRAYFTDPDMRDRMRRRVLDTVTAETRVLVGHSLGSVVAYEVLCAQTDLPVATFVTLGSPLGIPNLVFDRLEPEPGRWPNVGTWTNIADRSDVVALVKELRPLFGVKVTDISVQNGAKAHDMRPYLTARETGEAIRGGLEDAAPF
jgi:pimeloyl-ACP methyl ester carboxylesterase